MLFTFSGTTVLLGLAALSLLTGLTIYCFRLLANRRAGGELPHKIIPSYTQPIHALAFCVAISASLLAINWTVPVTVTELPAYVVEELDIIDTKIPVTKTPPPPPPPPPPPLIEPIQDEIVEEAPVFESQDVTEQDLLPPPAPPRTFGRAHRGTGSSATSTPTTGRGQREVYICTAHAHLWERMYGAKRRRTQTVLGQSANDLYLPERSLPGVS